MFAGASGTQQLVLAEVLGLAMARRAADILERHRGALSLSGPSGGTGSGGTGSGDTASGGAASGDTASGDTASGDTAQRDDEQFAADNAIFTAVLDAANECLGRFDARPADDRWCDALLQILTLGQLAELE